DPNEAGFDALGKGEAEGRAPNNLVSKGLTRSRTDRLVVVPPSSGASGGATSASSPSPERGGSAGAAGRGGVGGARVTALASTSPRAESTGAVALKAEPQARLSPAQELEQKALETRAQPSPKSFSEDARERAFVAAEKRAEAKAKGYEGEACTECGNFTLVRNGTCMKCDTCGSTTGCS
ncbi:MAG TPA: vitamin B12-dependent ribonucleotide reductase, partial [Pseudolabrys sp.]|nr:vitamin B12-dependent ribonucleotide reductase [Pseudolabrys sp.]